MDYEFGKNAARRDRNAAILYTLMYLTGTAVLLLAFARYP